MNEQQVIETIGKENWDKFCVFMKGQTVKIENNEIDYYNIDVDRFCNMHKIRRGE